MTQNEFLVNLLCFLVADTIVKIFYTSKYTCDDYCTKLFLKEDMALWPNG